MLSRLSSPKSMWMKSTSLWLWSQALLITSVLVLISAAVMAGPADPVEAKLMQAIHAGDSGKVQVALERGAKLNQPLADGSLPLAWAVDAQNLPLVKLLLAKGAKPDLAAVGTQNFSPLIVACQRGDPLVVAALLDAGAEVNRTTASGISPLALCAGNSSVAIVKHLLELGAKLDASDDTGQSPLMWAAAKGQVESIKLLLARGADVNQQSQAGFTPLFFAIKSGNPHAPIAVLAGGGNADYIAPDGTSAVQLAIYQKQFDVAAVLIKRGVDLKAFDRNGNQLLHAAVLNQQPKLVELLLAQGANPNRLTGPSKVVWRYEVNFTARPYVVHPKSPLLLAAEIGATEIMRALVAAGCDTQFRSQDGNNVVLAAAQSNPVALAFALSLAPNANTTDNSGRTPLHLLMDYSSSSPLTNVQVTEMFKLLAKQGARIDIADKSGQTPVDLAEQEQFRAKAEFEKIFYPPKGAKI